MQQPWRPSPHSRWSLAFREEGRRWFRGISCFPCFWAKTLASARNPTLSPVSAFRSVKSFHHKGLIQETKVRSKRSYLKMVKASQVLGFLHWLLSGGLGPAQQGGALQLCRLQDVKVGTEVRKKNKRLGPEHTQQKAMCSSPLQGFLWVHWEHCVLAVNLPSWAGSRFGPWVLVLPLTSLSLYSPAPREAHCGTPGGHFHCALPTMWGPTTRLWALMFPIIMKRPQLAWHCHVTTFHVPHDKTSFRWQHWGSGKLGGTTKIRNSRFLYPDVLTLYCSVASRVRLFATTWTAACQASLPLTISQSLPKFMSTASVMTSSHLILWHPLLLPSIFPSIRDFSNELAVHIRWPKYWSFSFNISPSNEYAGLISIKIDRFDPPAVQGTLRSLLQHHSSKVSILWRSAFFMSRSHKHVWPLGSP